jgi:hypothetical protein
MLNLASLIILLIHFIFQCFQGQDQCMNSVITISNMTILILYNLTNILAHCCIINYNIFITHFFNYLTNNVHNVCSHLILL